MRDIEHGGFDTILANYQSYIVMAIQFFLGMALGYIAVRALKYIIAFVAILALGTMLTIWSLNILPEEVFARAREAAELFKSLAVSLGILVVGPTSLGFVIGVLIALFRR